jgi:hypothetical protein
MKKNAGKALTTLAAIFGIITTLSLTGCQILRPSSPPKFDWFETNPQKMVGYGYVNQWIQCSKSDWEQMADNMVRAGLNVTEVELLSYGADGYYDRPNEAVDKFKEFAKIFKRRNITILVNVINWNVGEGLPENGKISICESRFNLEWYANIVNRIKNEVGETGIILQAASEWGPGSRNSGCWRKAEEFANWTAQNWGGMKMYNKSARPSSAPANHYIGYHILNEKNFGGKSPIKVIMTDTSSILNYLGGLRNHANNHDRLAKLTKDVKNHGCGFILYGFCSPSIDFAAIDVIGQAWYH